MRSILSMFAKSPFKPLADHMKMVKACVDQIGPLFSQIESQDQSKVLEIAKQVEKMEHKADIIKDGIRTQVPQGIFLPVEKRDFMHLLSAQDDIADAVEDLAVLVTIKELTVPENMKEPLNDLVRHVSRIANSACDMIFRLDDLLEASFGGPEAEKFEKNAHMLGQDEWEADKKQFHLAQKLFSLEDILKATDLLLWNEVIKKLGAVADKSEQIGKILRMFLAR